ncbi:MAG: hypothetical protein ACREA0_21670, partial [bacterium]
MEALVVSLVVSLFAAPIPPSVVGSTPVCPFVEEGLGAKVVVDRGYELAFDVILPEGYEEEAESGFPVLYVIHTSGAGVGCDSTIDEIREATAELVAEKPIVVVIRAHETSADSEFRLGPPWPVSHVWRLVPYIDAKYRVVQDRRYRFIAGYT